MPLVVGAVRASSVVLDASERAQVSSPQVAPTAAEASGDRSDPATEPMPEVVAAAPADPAQSQSGLIDEDVADADEPSGRTAELSADEIAALGNAKTELMPSPFDGPTPDTQPDVASPQEIEDAVAVNLSEDRAAELLPPAASSSDPSGGSTEPAILAVLCPNGHANPPDTTSCRVCGGPVGTHGPQLVGPPVLAVLRASDGTSAEVDRPVLIGRAPSSDRSSSRTPRLMTVPSPNHDISRTHLEVAPDDWQVVVTDLNSTNGTILVWPGDVDRQQLAPGERIPVQVGSVMELGDGVSVLIDFPQ
jgi:hypothetical protein